MAGKVAALIPAYEAAASVGTVVERTLAVVPSVYVVDDGSSDGTGEIARASGAKVLTHEHNQGKGRALQTGFAALLEAGFDGVITLDADGQHIPEEILKLLEKADAGADLVLGVRDQAFESFGRVRRMANSISSRLISFAAGQSIPDIQTGFRYYGRRLLEEVGLQETGFEAESAIVVRAARRGYRVLVTPVRLDFADGRCTSHYRPWTDSLRIGWAVFRARCEVRR